MINLRQMIRRAGFYRRKTLTLPVISPTRSLVIDLASIAVKVPRAWYLLALGPILTAYDRSLAQASGRTHDSSDDVQAELDAAEQELYRLILTITPKVNDWTVLVERWHRRKTAQALLTPTGVDLTTMLGAEGETVATFQRSILALIRNIDDDARSKIGGLVFRGLQSRTPRREIAKAISEVADLSRKRALFIAQDQAVKLAARLDQARQVDLGFEEYIWRHSHKARPRPEHVVRDGIIYRWDTPPADGPPGTLPHCGCKAQAHMNLEE